MKEDAGGGPGVIIGRAGSHCAGGAWGFPPGPANSGAGVCAVAVCDIKTRLSNNDASHCLIAQQWGARTPLSMLDQPAVARKRRRCSPFAFIRVIRGPSSAPAYRTSNSTLD